MVMRVETDLEEVNHYQHFHFQLFKLTEVGPHLNAFLLISKLPKPTTLVIDGNQSSIRK